MMKHCIQFRKTSRELELLLQDVRLYPTRYVIFHLERKTNHIQGLPSDTIQNNKISMSYLDNVLFAIGLAIGFGYFS
jgi:hypothetical protein